MIVWLNDGTIKYWQDGNLKDGRTKTHLQQRMRICNIKQFWDKIILNEKSAKNKEVWGPDGWTDGYTDGRAEGQTDGRTDGRMDGCKVERMDGRMDRQTD